MDIRSVLIKDTTKEEREDIIRKSLDCGGGAVLYWIDSTNHRDGYLSSQVGKEVF